MPFPITVVSRNPNLVSDMLVFTLVTLLPSAIL